MLLFTIADDTNLTNLHRITEGLRDRGGIHAGKAEGVDAVAVVLRGSAKDLTRHQLQVISGSQLDSRIDELAATHDRQTIVLDVELNVDF